MGDYLGMYRYIYIYILHIYTHSPSNSSKQGILIQYFIQYGASFYGGGPNDPDQPSAAFRIPWGVQALPAALLIGGLFFFPESPRWLADQDRWEEALRVLADVHGGGDLNHPKVLAEYQEIEEVIRFEREEAISSYAELTKPRILKRVVLGMSIQMWSQLCGMNIMSKSPPPPARPSPRLHPAHSISQCTTSYT